VRLVSAHGVRISPGGVILRTMTITLRPTTRIQRWWWLST
jgi:hypothetical protein